MRKQLLNELEKEAPFRHEFKQSLIQSAKKTPNRMRTSLYFMVACILLIGFAGWMMTTYLQKSSQKQAFHATQIQSIEYTYIDDYYFLMNEEQKALIVALYNSKRWEMSNMIQEAEHELRFTAVLPKSKGEIDVLFSIHQEQSELRIRSEKGHLTVNDEEAEQLEQLLAEAFLRINQHTPSISKLLDGMESIQVNEGFHIYEGELLASFDLLLTSASFAKSSQISPVREADGFVDVLGKLDSKQRIYYWMTSDAVELAYGNQKGILTDETQLLFIQTLVMSGSNVPFVRKLTEENEAFIEPILTALQHVQTESRYGFFGLPQYIVNWNNEFYTVSLNKENDTIYYYVNGYGQTQLQQVENEFSLLQQMSEAQLNTLMTSFSWQSGHVSMIHMPNHTFRWNGQLYQLWDQGYTIVGVIEGQQSFASLSKPEYQQLLNVIRELGLKGLNQ